MNPFAIEANASEAQHQTSLFSWIRMCAEFGPLAAASANSYGVPGQAAKLAAESSWDRESVEAICLRRIFSIPNGAKMGARHASIQIAQGLTAGTPDIFVPWRSGFFIELKKPGVGNLSGVQKKAIDEFDRLGYKVFVCYGWIQAANVILVNVLKRGK